MSMKLRRESLIKIVSFFVVIYPIIFRYYSFIPYLTLGELVGCMLLICCFLMDKGKVQIIIPIMAFASLVLIRAVLSLFGNNKFITDSFGSGCRLVVLYIFIMVFLQYADYRVCRKYIDLVAILMVLYEIIQLVCAVKEVYPSTSLPFLMPIRNTDDEVLRKAVYGFRYRPCGLFGEPGELGGYLVLPLALNLYEEEKRKDWFVKAVIFTVGAIGSLSSTGIIMVLSIWALYVFKCHYSVKTMMLIVIGCICGVVIGFRFGVWSYLIDRTFGGSGISGILSSTHFKDIGRIFNESFDFSEILFGVGFIEPNGFLAGIPRLLYWTGLLGLFIYLLLLVHIYNHSTPGNRLLVTNWIILNIGGSYLLGAFALPYMYFMVAAVKYTGNSRIMGTEKEYRGIC